MARMKIAKKEEEIVKPEVIDTEDRPRILADKFKLAQRILKGKQFDFVTVCKECFGDFDSAVKYILEGYADGKTDAWMRTELGITQRQHYAWLKNDENYNAIVGFGQDLCQRHWECRSKQSVFNPLMNSGMIIFMLKKFPMYATTEFLMMNPHFNPEKQSLEGADARKLEKYFRELDNLLEGKESKEGNV